MADFNTIRDVRTDIAVDQNTSPKLDWRMALEAAGGDRLLLREILQALVEECPDDLDHLEKAQYAGDEEQFGRSVHTIKGYLRLFGPCAAETLADQLEATGINAREELLADFRQQIEAVLRSVQLSLASQQG